jgi:hypothetical protein
MVVRWQPVGRRSLPASSVAEREESRGVEGLSGRRQKLTQSPSHGPRNASGASTPQLLDFWTAISAEQSENVYENKG